MANGNGRGATTGRRWLAAVLVFLVGVGLLLLAVFGPVVWGSAFDAGMLKTVSWALIVVGVYVLLGVSLPALLSGRDQGNGEHGDNGANRRRDERKDGDNG